MVRTLLSSVLMSSVLMSAAEMPVLPPGRVEFHGVLRYRAEDGLDRFWVRIDPEVRGLRTVRLLYTPPPPAVLGGTQLADAPVITLDGRGRLFAWDDRAGYTGIERNGTYFQVNLDRSPPGSDTPIRRDVRTLAAEPAWERTLAPLLVAVVWRATGRNQVPCLDLVGDGAPSAVAWNGPRLQLAGREQRIIADGQGRLARIVDPTGPVLLRIDGWISTGETRP